MAALTALREALDKLEEFDECLYMVKFPNHVYDDEIEPKIDALETLLHRILECREQLALEDSKAMAHRMAEYADRLPYEKIEKLREIAGTGEMNWYSMMPDKPVLVKEEFGQVVFDKPVKNVTFGRERNRANGFDICIIFAEPKDE